MPYITKDTIDRVFEASNIVEVIQCFVELKKAGANWKGLSPWVAEKTGSFMVSPVKGLWKDFSSGKGGGSAVSFLMAKENYTYPEALEWLAKKYGIEINYDESKEAKIYHEKLEKREALRPLLEAAIRKYEEAFENLPEDHPAKIEIYKKRGYTQEIVEKYRIGYAPGNKFIYNLCKDNGRKVDAMDIGLISETNDKWFDRVIYPLIERKGYSFLAVGMAGRTLSEAKKTAKWINSSESELFKKDTFWYGLNFAAEFIMKKGEAWVLEGYNDVIGWQAYGIQNSVSSSGTAISRIQIKILKRLCNRIIFCFDPDAAGTKAMLKYIPHFLEEGFRVEMVFTNPKLDPDDFIRYWRLSQRKYDLTNLSSNKKYRSDGFKFLMDKTFQGKDTIDVAQQAKKLIPLMARIPDDALATIYTEWLSKESKIKITKIKSWLKDFEAEKVKNIPVILDDEYYRLPKEVKSPLEELRPTIERYQLFQAKNQIWIQEGSAPPFHFKSVSNFQIEIIQHMQDEKFPMKLVRINNVHNLERIFDMPSEAMNSTMAFENAVTAHGNFRWKGGRREHELLKTFLFDGMGTGRKIDVLGWQPEGFWVWNNKITIPMGDDIVIDGNGVFRKDDVSYYIPSANEIYRQNIYKYEAQKKVVHQKPSVTFQNFASQVMKVHRNHGMLGILFSISSIFQDIVVENLNSFPMLFLFGPASSGKDLLADCCQSFFGVPQTAINLEGGVSTIKAQVREFAQFCNIISHLSEYKNGDIKLDGVLKGLWDRRGYKRGNIDSHVGTESIPILSAVLMTGNYAPDQEALITRFIWAFMDKTTFTDKEIKVYEELSDMTKKGISDFTNQFLAHREGVKNNFKNKFREFKATLGQRHLEANSRMISNLSVLGTFYQMFKNIMDFPFTHAEMMDHFGKTIEQQMNKMSTASTINRWWDCFLASMRGTLADQIRVGRDFKIEGDKIYFNFTSCFNRVQRQWYTQYKDNAPAKGVMMDSLKKDKSFYGDSKATRMAPGRMSRSTSAYIVNINDIPIKDEIKFAVDFQRNEGSLFEKVPGSGQETIFPPPATPEKIENLEDGENLGF